MEGNNVCLSQGRGEAKDMGIRPDKELNRAELSFRRAIVYELFSHAFGEPEKEIFEFIKEGGFSEYMGNALCYHPCLKEGLILDLRWLKEETNEMDIDDMEVLYSHIASREKNLLYEGNYHHAFNAFEEMADIAGFYRAFGLDFGCERPDHLSLELEFMRMLCLKESKALLDIEPENAEICLNTQKEFLSCHLGGWTEELMEKTRDIRFYGILCQILERWIGMEGRFLSIRRKRLSYCQNLILENTELCLKEAGYEGIQ